MTSRLHNTDAAADALLLPLGPVDNPQQNRVSADAVQLCIISDALEEETELLDSELLDLIAADQN